MTQIRRNARQESDHAAVRLRSAAVFTLIALLAAAAVAVSPVALRVFDGAGGEWERLSFIGQTYGAVSALIAVFALVGVIGTLVFQARDSRRAIEETRRQAMSDLLKMAMDDPDLDECGGPIPQPADPKARKQQLYTNMIIAQWSAAFEAEAIPEGRLRLIAREMFEGRPGRTYWQRAGQGWVGHRSGSSATTST